MKPFRTEGDSYTVEINCCAQAVIFRASRIRRLNGVHKNTYVVNKVTLRPNKWLLECN
jgi:hypothetical protein